MLLYICILPTELFEQVGQYESLTTRIRNILREYKDGIGIFKELIQNADDAGATTVKFLVDWRNGPAGSLFSPGMAECQGPALWAYNNAVFSDEDFENIYKLAGETKVEDISKIGRFGLGFNAVYHVTDVPSFISREHLVVLDPNTHHLQHHIRDKSRSGVRINLAKNPNSLTLYCDQLQLYNGVFGCNIEKAKVSWLQWLHVQNHCSFDYDATLFRFPFRTVAQAQTSGISKTAYGNEKIRAIISNLCECSSTLLIFSQHVKKVEVYELDECSHPDEMRLILSVNKPDVTKLRESGMKSAEPFIRECSKWWKQYRTQSRLSEYPFLCEVATITTTIESSELNHGKPANSCDQKWLVVSASGSDSSLAIARSPEGRDRGYLPCGGAAFLIQKALNQSTRDLRGELFCFFPLSIPTGLPVHVNGNFAIMSNRVGIWKRTVMQKQQIEVDWNEALMEDALARAYIMLLENMKDLINDVPHYKFHTLWPNISRVDMHSWKRLVEKVCTVLLDTQSELFYSDGLWMSITDGILLSVDFNQIYETSVEILRSLGIHVFNLPSNILLTLKEFDCQKILQRRTLNFTEFLKQHFFPNIQHFASTRRDEIVCFGLDRILEARGIKGDEDLFRRNACIAVSANSRILVKPADLIHPRGAAAKLFSEEDHRFPVGNGLRHPNRLYALEKLGMVRDLDWKGILERARVISNGNVLANNESSRKLIKYLNDRINQLGKPTSHAKLLEELNILPVLRKPAVKYILPWKGSTNYSQCLCAPRNVFLPKDANLVGSSCLIVDTSESTGCGKLNNKVEDLLGLSKRLPEDKFVLQQLDEAMKYWNQLSQYEKQDAEKRSKIQSVCKEIYKFFNNQVINKTAATILKKLRKQHWLFIGDRFVQTKKVARKLNEKGAPFLYALPPNYQGNYYQLFQATHVKDTFDEKDFIDALSDLNRAKQGSPLTKDELQVATFFITEIYDRNMASKENIDDILLPDTNGILRPSSSLVVNLDLWLDESDDNLKVHEKIPLHTAHHLGAKSLKGVILKTRANDIGYGESFGQHEELTDRLKGILDGYPVDGILKELVQNADDAQASEIHLIHDTRSLKSEKVATDKNSDEVLGPALCVFNDRPFSKEDLDGIRNLGTGSKKDHPKMAGKYGIGFNSVYHLTDCPSFLSDEHTLAFLDPHCRHFGDNDRGQLFDLKSADEKFRSCISDTLKGYLPEHFKLCGSTMFRFPLRRGGNESKISNKCPLVEDLFQTFQKEAGNSLLFLNHVKKITLSKINSNDKLKEILRVESIITPEDAKKRYKSEKNIDGTGSTSVPNVGWESVSYILNIKENGKDVEQWLIQKRIGSDDESLDISDELRNEIANGRELGLLPSGGFAARLWSHSQKEPLKGTVYCFLPLPENYSNLPVHVNGRFALDNHRRRLWTNTDGEGPKCKWNHFINTCVLPPAYAALIKEARNHLCNDGTDNQLSRYHALFPNVLDGSPWNPLIIELYRYLGRTNAKVFPLLVPIKSGNEPNCSTLEKDTDSAFENLENLGSENSGRLSESRETMPVTCTEWVSADEAYFHQCSSENNFLTLLLQIGIPVLLYAPYRIYCNFKTAGRSSNEVTPKSVIAFLREFKLMHSTCKITNLPKKLETTAVKSVTELSKLINYCCEDDSFGGQLEDVPLLLTEDGYLRVFNSQQPVFCSKFGDLFPEHLHSFVHSEIVCDIPLSAIGSKEKIVIELTVRDLPTLLPDVFTHQVLIDIKDNESWQYPVEGTLSQKWLKKFWDLLQNDTKLDANDGDCASLKCLSEWPLIPTTSGKLVTIEHGKTVLDMTTAGNVSIPEQKVRTFLSNMKCPVLNKEITFRDEYASSLTGCKITPKKTAIPLRRIPAVTDAYVAHPHDALDVLLVLNHMLKTESLTHASEISEEETCNFLQFMQDNYQALKEHKELVRSLPFYKAFDGQFVSLTGPYSSCAVIPPRIPTEQFDELQERAKCLFLLADALPALEKLYKELGVKIIRNIKEFYTGYIFRHFSMFSTENQMTHLLYIRDKVHPSLPQGCNPEKDFFLKRMSQTACIPDKDGLLHKASEFFDQSNHVFEVMYGGDSNKFPPSLFNDESWSRLLRDIGLQVDITPEIFLQFCAKVAENGHLFRDFRQCRDQSKALVEYLFNEESLQQDDEFLSRVSQIEFIVQAEVEGKFSSMHKQYQCSSSGYPPFVKFSNAVPWRFRDLAWTSASILPPAEHANGANLKALNIAWSGPTHTDVLHHLQNVATSYNPDTVDSNVMHEITKAVYKHLCKSTQCYGRALNDECTEVCVCIGAQLKEVPCIFLQEDKVFVKGEQVVFKLPDNCNLKPFLYLVPRRFGDFEHLFKRLGAAERPTPKQITNVLNSIQQKFGDEVLHLEVVKKVIYAIHMLFQSLEEGETAEEINILYLLSQRKQLVRSSELIYQVSSRYTRLTEDLQLKILLRFKEFGLKKVPKSYIDALPDHLRPKKFDEIFREEVAPECKNAVCSEAKRSFPCKFQQRYEKLLISDEFQEGLQRLLLHESQDPKDYEQTIKNLQTNVQVKCVGTDKIKINITNRECNDVEPVANLEESCYAVQDEGMWTLYVQHEFEDDLVSIACCVNRILGESINEKMGLIKMLGCSSPCDISRKLNEFSIVPQTTGVLILADSDPFSGWDRDVESERCNRSGMGAEFKDASVTKGHGSNSHRSDSANFYDGRYGIGYRGGNHGGGHQAGSYHGAGYHVGGGDVRHSRLVL